jgi:hypothetical protein
MSERVIAGGCLCGAVRFEISDALERVVHCHCTMCQRAHGAAFVTWAPLPSERVRITRGDAEIVRYRSSEIGTRLSVAPAAARCSARSTPTPA